MREHVGDPTVQPRRELARRVSGGTEVTLYWSPYDNSTTVEVWQPVSGETLLLAVAPERALDAYYHPFAELARRLTSSSPSRTLERWGRRTLPAGRRLFPLDGDGSVLDQRCGGLRQSVRERRAG